MKRRAVAGILALGFFALSGMASAAGIPAETQYRTWFYGNFTTAFSPSWSLTVMPGFRYELGRSSEPDKPTRNLYFYELFVGPNYTHKLGDLTFKGSIWYYYTGYPQRAELFATATTPGASKYNDQHHLELIPQAEYKMGNFAIYDRIILHNTFYSDMYAEDAQKTGYGLVLRELIGARYSFTPKFSVSLAEEIFLGVIEDGDTSSIADNKGYHPLGFWKSGLRLNRVYLGVDYKILPTLSITPQYMLETSLAPADSSDVVAIGHYAFITVTYVLKLF